MFEFGLLRLRHSPLGLTYIVEPESGLIRSQAVPLATGPISLTFLGLICFGASVGSM